MRSAFILPFLLAPLVLGCGGEGQRSFNEDQEIGGERISAGSLNRGEFHYMRHCRRCHGAEGRGDGPHGASLDPPPRDLTEGQYPHAAPDGSLPSNEALSRVIREGVPGTGMTSQSLSESEALDVVHYLKTLSPRWREGGE